jgi:hypothetical protein
MMTDAPGYDTDVTDEDEMILTESNSEAIRNYINTLM